MNRRGGYFIYLLKSGRGAVALATVCFRPGRTRPKTANGPPIGRFQQSIRRVLRQTMHVTRVGNGVFPVDSESGVVPPSFSEIQYPLRETFRRERAAVKVVCRMRRLEEFRPPTHRQAEFRRKESVSISAIVPLSVTNQSVRKYLDGWQNGSFLRHRPGSLYGTVRANDTLCFYSRQSFRCRQFR
jgi:hypothetical protein